jgi:hypothetical protein
MVVSLVSGSGGACAWKQKAGAHLTKFFQSLEFIGAHDLVIYGESFGVRVSAMFSFGPR